NSATSITTAPGRFNAPGIAQMSHSLQQPKDPDGDDDSNQDGQVQPQGRPDGEREEPEIHGQRGIDPGADVPGQKRQPRVGRDGPRAHQTGDPDADFI